MLNKLLQRQIQKHLGRSEQVPEQLAALLKDISESYDHYEKDRNMLEHSIELTSAEMIELNNRLRKEAVQLKDAQQKLENANKELNSLFNNVHEVLFSVDMISFRLTQISAACKLVYGYTPDEFYADPNLWERVIYPEDKPIVEAQTQELFTGKTISNQYRIIHKDGDVRWLENSIIPTQDDKGVLIRLDGISTDITERKKIEEALQKSETKYRLLFYNSPLPKWIYDQETLRILDVNDAAVEHYGYSRLEFLNMSIRDIRPPEDIPLLLDSNKTKRVSKGITHFGVWNHRNKNGEIMKMEIAGHAIHYNNRNCMIVVCNDVTQKLKAEAALKLSNERYEYATAATSDAIWDWDLIQNVIYWAKGIEGIFGYKIQDTPSSPSFWTEHIHPDDLQRVEDLIYKTIEGSELSWTDEYRFLKANGEYASVLDNGIIIRDKDGKAVRMIGAMQDISDRKQKEEALIAAYKEIDTILESFGEGFIAIDPQWYVTYWNWRAEEVTGIKKEEILHKSFLEALPWIKNTEFYRHYQRAFAENVQVHFTEYAEQYNKWFEISAYPSSSGLSIYFKDVTRRMESENQLNILNQELEQRAAELLASNAELERFAFVASHDLQEPLRMVTSFLQLLQRKYHKNLDETGQQYIRIAVEGSERMKQLISDLLQYSRVGTSLLELGPVDMNNVMSDILLIFHHEIHATNARIEYQDLPEIIAGKTAMTQLLQNLVGNALKYRSKTEPPHISISCTEDSEFWKFTVKDNGIGIDRRFTEKIFIVFQRLHNKDEYSGTGIGLAICKKIVERYKGKIWVESELGKGSKFEFTISKHIS